MRTSNVTRHLLTLVCILYSSTIVKSQSADNLLLKNYRPVSIFNIPMSLIENPRYPAIDFHSHDYAETDEILDSWVALLEKKGIKKTVILSRTIGTAFDSLVTKYSRYKDKFELWCGFDYRGFGTPDWERNAIAELERCHQKGATGIGELVDNGWGVKFSENSSGSPLHFDDPRLYPLYLKCAELGMPVNIHIGEDAWMYLPPDSLNDGLMNGAIYKVDTSRKGFLHYNELFSSLARTVANNPSTIFIASHYLNSCANLEKLGKLLDLYPNLYADISARYGEIAAIPRFAKAFIETYQDKLLYGTDMGIKSETYDLTFRILETSDEHFYSHNILHYHWPLSGLGLGSKTLKKIYFTNANKILTK